MLTLAPRTGEQASEHRRQRTGKPKRTHRLPEPSTRLECPPIVTVYRGADGEIVHAWCGQPLDFHGRRAELEVDFYCVRCIEHVTLPQVVMSRIPIKESGWVAPASWHQETRRPA